MLQHETTRSQINTMANASTDEELILKNEELKNQNIIMQKKLEQIKKAIVL